MVRETRYLYVGNLPDSIIEERILDLFSRLDYSRRFSYSYLLDKPFLLVMDYFEISYIANKYNVNSRTDYQ